MASDLGAPTSGPFGFVWSNEQHRHQGAHAGPARYLFPVGDALLRAGDALHMRADGLVHRDGKALVGYAAHDPLPTTEEAHRYADKTWGVASKPDGQCVCGEYGCEFGQPEIDGQ